MAKFLFTTWSFAGHLYPNIAIAHALRERGHRCAFYTGAEACLIVEEEGFEGFPFQHVDEDALLRVMYSPRLGPLQWRECLGFKRTLRKWLLETVPSQVADLEAVLSKWKPDVIVCDPTMWGPILVLYERTGIPVAISSFVPGCMLPGPDAPPFGLGLPRPRNWPTRLLARLAAVGIDIVVADFRQAANALRKRYGLPPLKMSVTEYTGQMPLYLVPSAPEFDYQRHDLPPSVRYVGPCLWNRPHHSSSADWLSALPEDQPWVHVTEGTFHREAPFVLRAAAQGLAGLPMQVIMTTGMDRDPAKLGLGPLAPNVHLAQWIPHSELLPRTDVVVTTGGAGTVLAALSEGVPLVVVPTGWDKPENAQRVVEAGVGVRLAPRNCTPQRLRSAVERVLADPSFRRQARWLASIFARYRGPAAAAELLERLSWSCWEGEFS